MKEPLALTMMEPLAHLRTVPIHGQDPGFIVSAAVIYPSYAAFLRSGS